MSVYLQSKPLSISSLGYDGRAWIRLLIAKAPTAETPIWSKHSESYTAG